MTFMMQMENVQMAKIHEHAQHHTGQRQTLIPDSTTNIKGKVKGGRDGHGDVTWFYIYAFSF